MKKRKRLPPHIRLQARVANWIDTRVGRDEIWAEMPEDRRQRLKLSQQLVRAQRRGDKAAVREIRKMLKPLEALRLSFARDASPSVDAFDCNCASVMRRCRKPVVTPERIAMICGLLAKGESEQAACLRAGISSTAWGVAKRKDASLRERIAGARDQWAQLQHARHIAALDESRAMRAANRRAIKPRPIHQAKLVAWHLTFRVPLHFAAIPDAEIAPACERFNLPLETWQRQESAFGLLKKVYARRAQLRGQQPLNATSNFHAARVADGEEKNAAPTGDDKSAMPASQPDPVYQRMHSIGKGESLSVGKTGSSPEENEF
jgi:hypothetical protein